MRMVSASPKKFHILASRTTGTAEKNIISQDNGILDLHRNAQYFGNGDKEYKIPHIKFENKIIFVLGYDNKDKWENALGGQYGCVFIDEINTANIEFVRELSTRNEYLLATLNPDDPDLPVYKEFVNCSRPFRKYLADVPESILAELTEPEKSGWKYWFFSFRDNASLTPEEIQRKMDSAPAGTKLYKNKIQGLRGRATGLIFANFDRKQHCFHEGKIRLQIEKQELKFIQFSAGLDTAYSSESADVIAMTFIGIDNKSRLLLLAEEVIQNADLKIPVSPSDLAERFVNFLETNRQKWGFARDVYIDSADQATITEIKKYKRKTGCLYNFINSYKKLKIIDRIHLQSGWIASGHYLVNETCIHHLHELSCYSWQENQPVPEDKNDHTINSVQYAFIPYKDKIGKDSR